MLGAGYPWVDDRADDADCLPWVEEAPFLSARDDASLSNRTFVRVHRA